MGADRPASERVPELPGFSGAEEFLAAACEVSEDRGTPWVNSALGLPATVIGIFEGEGRSMLLRDMNAMLWFADRWWWFPTASTDLDSAVFEWRNNRVYLLEPDGSAVEGIVFVGDASPD